MSHIERRQTRLAQIRHGMEAAKPNEADEGNPRIGESSIRVESLSPSLRYSIGASQNVPLSLNAFLPGEGAHRDPYLVVSPTASPLAPTSLTSAVVQDFMPKLKQHLIRRLLEKMGLTVEDVTPEAWRYVQFQGNRLYSHKLMRLNYTTYDVRRDEDIIHVDTPRSNIMLLNSRYSGSPLGQEPVYLYAHVLGIFHANVSLARAAQIQQPSGKTTPSSVHRIEFMWVQWYTLQQASAPFTLECVVLRPPHADTLDFLEPAAALRAVHLIPRFALGKLHDPAPTSRVVIPHDWTRWKAYYVNRCVLLLNS